MRNLKLNIYKFYIYYINITQIIFIHHPFFRLVAKAISAFYSNSFSLYLIASKYKLSVTDEV